jgi:predicted Fe-S protein YdhL (DUF1289 family)
MKYNPCADACTTDGTHCAGCGRSHAEIAEVKQLVKSAVELIRRRNYENPETFVEAISKSILKKLTKPE